MLERVDAQQFNGPWIGETTGADAPAHVWEITVIGIHLRIDTWWEGFPQHDTLYGTHVDGEAAFNLDYYAKLARMVDPQHFVIVGWDSKHSPTAEEAYDVVFSRPGVAELSAQEAYRRFRDSYAYAA